MNSILVREHATALYEHTRSLLLVHIADLGYKVAAWAEARDIDHEWLEEAPL